MRRIQGWDPLLIISQIISLQTIHYLLLAALLPPFLQLGTNREALEYAGGPRVTGYVLDWREIASRSTAPVLPRRPPGTHRHGAGVRRAIQGEPPSSWRNQSLPPDTNERIEIRPLLQLVASPNHRHQQQRKRYQENIPSHYAVTDGDETDYEVWDYGVSRTRGWIVAAVWVGVCALDIIPLYYLVRKPTLILDFACTLTGLHMAITIYYSGFRFPASFFWWAVMAVGTVLMIVGAEQLCVRREMEEGLGNVEDPDLEGLVDAAESYELDER